jgi:hypothetical protein
LQFFTIKKRRRHYLLWFNSMGGLTLKQKKHKLQRPSLAQAHNMAMGVDLNKY